jgi:Resolvase, N terminal domain
MAGSRRPAAYIGACPGDSTGLHRQQLAISEGARQRGWRDPVIYAEDSSPGCPGERSALERLEAAIVAGRHDALLITDPAAALGTARHLLGLLHRCTRAGVTVGFLVPSAMTEAAAPPSPPAAAPSPPVRDCGADWEILAGARLDALSGLYPGWRIWLDSRGWHARRRGEYLQGYRSGAPAFHVRADTATDLAAQLCWQQAADAHAPEGCQARAMLPPPWGASVSQEPAR